MRQNKNVRNWIEQKELWELRPKPDKIDFQKLDKISSVIEPFLVLLRIAQKFFLYKNIRNRTVRRLCLG